LSLLFVHHSVGDQLLAQPGPEGPGVHPNGGGLRKLLTETGYELSTATYGSRLGENTDLFDWPEKFVKHMDELLATADGNKPLPGGKRHDIVMFKSCFPNNAFSGRGDPPGSPKGPELTLENARAALKSLLPEFQKRPDVLFVYLTAPPLAANGPPDPLWKWLVKGVLGKSSAAQREREAVLAREFNDWVVDEGGWLAGYPLRNVAATDYYDMLTDTGASNFLRYPTGENGTDDHPSSEGQKKVAPQVLGSLNRHVERAGIGKTAASPGATPAGDRLAVGDEI
jgi:hypothetical protein